MKAMKLSYTFKGFFFLSIMMTIPSLLRNQQFVKNIKQRQGSMVEITKKIKCLKKNAMTTNHMIVVM
jgi:hypothetical protein